MEYLSQILCMSCYLSADYDYIFPEELKALDFSRFVAGAFESGKKGI